MRIWVLLVTLVVVACSTGSAPRSPRRAAYIRDLSTVNVVNHEICEVIPYGLGPFLTPARGPVLASWIDEQHARGLRVIAPIAGSARVAEIRAFGAARFDGFVTEVEYWRRPDREVAFGELLDLVRELRAMALPGTPIGVYLGYPTRDEAVRLAAVVDFVFLNSNVRDTRRASERLENFAGTRVAIWPIVYAEGEANMHGELAAHGLAPAERRLQHDYGSVAGFVYFTARALP